jgi:omega-6 fatty acid desaturase (delta-12 desaturase)
MATMRTGPELIRATKRYASDQPAKSWGAILSTSVLLLAFLAGTIWNFNPAGKLFCSVLTGLLILRLFVIYHDQQHHSILPNSRLAELLMRAFGIYALSPSSIWRSSHNYHHKHNSRLRGSHIGSFPIMTREHYLKAPRSTRLKYRFMRHPLTILFGYIFMFLHGMCVYPFFNNRKAHLDCLVAFIVHVGLGTALVTFVGWDGLLYTQTIPHAIACAIGSYLFYAQHNFPGVILADKAALESSSFLKTNRLMAWFTANIGYHHVHHLNAKIPFYRLPEAMKRMPELRHPKTTSLSPWDIYQCLRLKVWDAQAQQLVSLGATERKREQCKKGDPAERSLLAN